MNFRAGPDKGGAGRGRLGNGAAWRNHAREPGVLSIKPFRRLWIALSLSSLGDWLSIVALTVLAPSLAHGIAAKGWAVVAVWLATLLPALLFGPLAGAVADRLDRRMVMIVGDVVRGLLFLSIPLFPHLIWIIVAKFLAGIASQFWNPATAASIPNLVPKDKLERANQLSLLTTYGTAPLAAGLFSVLALVSEGISRVTPLFHASSSAMGAVDLALYFNAASYGISALTVYFIREIPKRHASDKISVPSVFRSLVQATAGAGELVMSGYAAAYAVLLVMGGRLGDLFGRNWIFMIGMTGFALCSAWCGLAWSPYALVMGRLLQGAAAAIMAPQVAMSSPKADTRMPTPRRKAGVLRDPAT